MVKIIEYATDSDFNASMFDDGFPKTGFNAKTGLLADDSKQKTIQPYPIIKKDGKVYMKSSDDTYPERRGQKVTKEVAKIKGIDFEPKKVDQNNALT